MSPRRRRMIGGLCAGLVAGLCTMAANGASPTFASAGVGGAAAPVTPNRFDPTSRAASASAAQAHPQLAAPASTTRVDPVGNRPAPRLAAPTTVALDAAKPVRLTSGDSALQVDVPAGAVTAGDMQAAGGAMSLLVRQVAPASGGSAGGSGIVSLGRYLLQVLDASGHVAGQGLRKPLGVKLGLGTRAAALDVRHAVAIVNAPLPPGSSLEPPAPAAPIAARSTGTAIGEAPTATPAARLGPTTRQPATLDAQASTLSTSALVTTNTTTVGFDSTAPVSTFGAPSPTETNPSAGSLTFQQPLSLPAGPGGLTPPLTLGYDSAAVNDQHDVAGAAPWVGEGWHLTLGGISWAERDIGMGCGTSTTTPCEKLQMDDVWQLTDAFGTQAELIPPQLNVSTYYEDNRGTAITPSPMVWHTAPETHARVVSFTGPNALPRMPAKPPCFRVFLPSGIMEEFGCTPDSVQFYQQPLGSQTRDFIASWLPDLITDPSGNQIHITYQTNSMTVVLAGLQYTYPRDAVMATVEYDSPGCHDTMVACTGAAWTPLMRVSFQASHAVAHVSGSSCPSNGIMRCDDPADLSGSGDMADPMIESTFVLNDVLVQVRASGTAAWNTLRDYRLAYDQGPGTPITDPFSGLSRSTAGRLLLTGLTEIGADGSTALPGRTFAYTRQTQRYEDSIWGLSSQSYSGNSYYLSSMSNGQGLTETFSWQNARSNATGVPAGADPLDPFACNARPNTAPCAMADDGSWSRIVLTQRTETVLRLSQAGQGGVQTSTPVTGTTTFSYRLAPAGPYWGDSFDRDVLDFYNMRFMGFATATVTNPDGSVAVHQYPQTAGPGVYSTTDPLIARSCARISCTLSPWWLPANALHGREIELDRYNPDGSLQQVTTTHHQAVCPPAGVTPDMAGNLVSQLDPLNPVAVCDVAPTQVDTYFVDGGSKSTAPHVTTTYALDSYGRVTAAASPGNDGGATGSPTTIVQRTSYATIDSVTATATSATGLYMVDRPSFQDTEDGAGSRSRCAAATYDTAGRVSLASVYTSCGTAANGFAPSGQTSAFLLYDASGNPIAANDPDSVAGDTAHQGCTVLAVPFRYSACAVYDGTFAVQPVSLSNALGQVSTTAYQPPASGTATTGFGLWPISTTDTNQQTTSYTYDALGRPTGVTLPGETAGLTTRSSAYTFWCSGTGAQAPCLEVDRTQRLNSSTTVTARAFYDGFGRLVETRTPAPGGQDVVSYWFYDQSGRVAFHSVPYFAGAYTGAPGASAYSIPDSGQAGTTYTYDGLGRVTSTTDALSHRSTVAYSMVCAPPGTGDPACYEQVRSVDAGGHQGGELVDALGRTDYEQRYTGASASTYAVYATTKLTFDAAGDLLQLLHPDGVTKTTAQYDAAGRKTTTTDPDRGTQTYAYDPGGNLVQSVDARGAGGTVFAGYDGLNRPLWNNTSNSPTGAFHTYAYDGTLGGSSGVGRLTAETFSAGAGSTLSGGYSFTYDGRGRQTGQTLTVGAASYPLQTTYDDAGNVLSQQYPDGETVTNAYTGQGWLSGVSTTRGTTTTPLLSGAVYTGVAGAFGDVTGASVGGTAYRYSAADDLLGRSTDLAVTNGAGSTTLFDQSRTFDAVGNVSSATTTLPGGTDSQAFCYDEQNRLTWAGSTGTAPCSGTAVPAGTLTAARYTQSFTYDAMGRLATGPLGSYSYGRGGPVHAATAVGSGYTARYDAAGDMICRAATAASTCAGASATGAQLAYDPAGQLASWRSAPANPSSAVTYLYDCQGQRVAQQVTQAGVTTTTVYVGGVEEIASSGATTTTKTYYYAGGRRIAMAVDGTFSYLASDGQGSTDVVLGASGSVVASQLFAPYGGLRYTNGAMPTSYGFTGQQGDAVSGLDYYHARYYDPVAGQYTSPDTEVPGGGLNLWGLSRYAYTRGNPTTRTDPTGHDDDGGGFGGGFGGDFGGFGGDFGGFGDGDFGSFGDGDFGGSGFDSSAPSLDSSEDLNFGMSGFDPSAPSLDRSEDTNFGMPTSDAGTGTGFDSNAPALDRSEDPDFGMAGVDPNAPALDRSEDPDFGMAQEAQLVSETEVLAPGPWTDVYERAMKLARSWEQAVHDGDVLDLDAARQQYTDVLGQIHAALADPTVSMLGTRALGYASYQLYASATIAGVVRVGNMPVDALGVIGGGGRAQPGFPRR